MTKPTLVALALALAGCAGAPVVYGPDPLPPESRPIRYTFTGTWDTRGQGFIGAVPLTAALRFKGNATIDVLPVGPPFLRIDGDADFIVTPVAGLEVEAVRAMSSGDVEVYVGGVRILAPHSAVEPEKNKSMPTPPPAPMPVVKPPEPVACVGPTCSIPTFTK